MRASGDVIVAETATVCISAMRFARTPASRQAGTALAAARR